MPSQLIVNQGLEGKEAKKHEQLNLSFWRLFLHFCEYISTSFQSFKAVKQTFIVFLMKLLVFTLVNLSCYQGSTWSTCTL